MSIIKKGVKNAIIITSINPPTAAVKAFAKFGGFTLFVAGDNKSPKNWNLPGTNFLSISYQKNKYPDFSKYVCENHYARKNFAYLEAISNGAKNLYETDDDNIPNKFFPNFYNKVTNLKEVSGSEVVNIYRLFTKKNVWPRGLPLNLILSPIAAGNKVKVQPLIQQTLADLDPDVDAIYRLTVGKNIKFDKNKAYAIKKGTYCPFNSQSTMWKEPVFPLLFLPSTVSSRATDIWRGYIAQRILWELNSQVIYLSPSVYQMRNPHNFMRDFTDEIEVYTQTETLLTLLKNISLKGDLKKMLLSVYKELARNGIVKEMEISALSKWLKYF